MDGVILATVIVGITGLVLGLFLTFFSDKFKVEVDPKEAEVREALPGNNCGGCGFPGCDGLAKAIAAGEAPVNGCPVGGEACANAIAAIMGVEAGESVREYAYVKCNGNCNVAKDAYAYDGPKDCALAMTAPGGGPKGCTYGCLGFGNCVKACPFDAITIQDGIASIDKEKCKACGKCVIACPKHLIELIPETTTHIVSCSSKDKGKDVMGVCKVGCIGCGICAKNCPANCITVENNIAYIDQSQCKHCGLCATKCPKKIILTEK